VAGYCAVTNRFDAGAFILFMILALWQMPHFYAIAMYRLEEYKAADIPVLPAVKGMSNTKLRIFQYMIAFFGAVIALTLAGYTGYTYLVIMTVLCLVWLWRGAQGLRTEQHILWARKIFLFSLIVLTTFSVLLALNAFLP
jgi:protoheme IX farnesyltransferase